MAASTPSRPGTEEGWERAPHVEVSRELLQHLIAPVFSGRRVAGHRTLSTGLANTNIWFVLDGGDEAFVLRVHTRDPRAAAREQAIMALLRRCQPTVPVAELCFTEPRPHPDLGHPYAVWRFSRGTLLQQVFQTATTSELCAIATACGRELAKLTALEFPVCGAFDEQLRAGSRYGPASAFVPTFIYQALFEGRAGVRVGSRLRDEIWRYVGDNAPTLAVLDSANHLVHGDFKRSNILVEGAGGDWRVTAIVDWEFCFAGPPLVDVGNFLRAGSALPPGFCQAFARGYRVGGGRLPNEWRKLSRLIDLTSQVEFLNRPVERPNVFAETLAVVRETLSGACLSDA